MIRHFFSLCAVLGSKYGVPEGTVSFGEFRMDNSAGDIVIIGLNG